MAVERRQPLPAGRYWIDTTGQRTIVLQGWLQANRSLGLASVEATEKGGTNGNPALWTLFSTTQPLIFPAGFLGFPTIATPDVHTKADTVSRPPTPPGPFDPGGFFDGIPNIPSTLLLVGLAYLAFKD